MKEIYNKLDKIQDDITEIKEVLVKNTADIAHHIRRTDLAEESIVLIRQESEKLKDMVTEEKVDIRSVVKDELKPIKAHVAFVKGALWAIGITGTVLFAAQQMGILSKLLR